MARSIPPRTMRDVSRERGGKGRPPLGGGLGEDRGRAAPRTAFPVAAVRKPRQWRFETKPLFRRVREPLVDVFHEAEEVLIVVDLGGFKRGEISLTMTPEKYLIHAKKEDQEFREEIPLPREVNVEDCVENFRNGVLEIVLPRKKKGG